MSRFGCQFRDYGHTVYIYDSPRDTLEYRCAPGPPVKCVPRATRCNRVLRGLPLVRPQRRNTRKSLTETSRVLPFSFKMEVNVNKFVHFELHFGENHGILVSFCSNYYQVTLFAIVL